jgi:hypothetical protein
MFTVVIFIRDALSVAGWQVKGEGAMRRMARTFRSVSVAKNVLRVALQNNAARTGYVCDARGNTVR